MQTRAHAYESVEHLCDKLVKQHYSSHSKFVLDLHFSAEWKKEAAVSRANEEEIRQALDWEAGPWALNHLQTGLPYYHQCQNFAKVLAHIQWLVFKLSINCKLSRLQWFSFQTAIYIENKLFINGGTFTTFKGGGKKNMNSCRFKVHWLTSPKRQNYIRFCGIFKKLYVQNYRTPVGRTRSLKEQNCSLQINWTYSTQPHTKN